MHRLNVILGITNIVCGIVFILISLPLVYKRVPMNHYYGFRIAKSFSSEENWYEINRFGGRQLIRWSVLLVAIGILYFVFPIDTLTDAMQTTFFAAVPIVLCIAASVWKTILFAHRL